MSTVTQVDWLTNIADEPFADTRRYNFTPLSPSVVLSANQSTTVSLIPAPPGLAVGDWLYIATVGTPEVVQITALSVVGTTANVSFMPAQAHGLGWTIRSATSGVQQAINAVSAGGIVQMPPGNMTWYAPVTIGNGSNTSPSTIRGIRLLGAGRGNTNIEAGASYDGTSILWAGSGSVPVIQMQGPAGNFEVGGFMIDCNPNGVAAAEGMNLISIYGSFFHDIAIMRHDQYGILLDSYPNPTGGSATGTSENVWLNVKTVAEGTGSGGNGITGIGIGRSSAVNNTSLDVAKQTFIGCHFTSNDSVSVNSIAIQVGFADALTFIGCECSGFQYDLAVITPIGSGMGVFPDAITFIHCYLTCGKISVNQTNNAWTPLYPIQLTPGNYAETTLPSGFMALNGRYGFSIAGSALGTMSGADVSSGTTITPTGQQFRVTGTTTVQSIALPFTGFEGTLIIIPDGSLPFGTSGNIAASLTASANVPVTATYLAETGKWYLK